MLQIIGLVGLVVTAVMTLASVMLAFFPSAWTLIIGRRRWGRHAPAALTSVAIAGLAALAYSIGPLPRTDLATHYRVLDSFRHGWVNYTSAGDIGAPGSPLILATLLFHFVALLPDNRWLQTISVIVSYGCLAFAWRKFSSMGDSPRLQIIARAIVWLAGVLLFHYVISGVRMAMAFSIATVALSLDVSGQARARRRTGFVCIVLYIAPCLIHPAAVFIGLLRLISMAPVKARTLVAGVASAFPLLLLLELSVSGSTINMTMRGSVGLVAQKLALYFGTEAGTFRPDDWRLYAVQLVIAFGVAWAAWLTADNSAPPAITGREGLTRYILSLSVLTLAAAPISVLLDRLIVEFAFLGLPIAIMLDRIKGRIVSLVPHVAVVISIVLVMYNIAAIRGNMDVSALIFAAP